MRRRESLIGQVVAVNVLLILAVVFAASAASSLNLKVSDAGVRAALIALAAVTLLLANGLLLRRRFLPLETLLSRVEAIDPANPADFQPLPTQVEEVERLARAFRRLLRRIEEERRRSGRMILKAQEEERRRLARDLHDEVNQALTAILLRLGALSHDAPAELAPQLAELKALVNQAMEELLTLARQLRPAALDDHGLVPAIQGQLRRFSEQTGIDATLHVNGNPAAVTDDDQQAVIYRVVQEALSNVAQHSGAKRVRFDLVAFQYGGVELRVRDNGRGFDPARTRERTDGGIGLHGMVERARLVGGELSISSTPGEGTAVKLYIPQ